MPPRETEVLATPDMTEHHTQQFVDAYSNELRGILKEFNRTPSYEADGLMKILASAWLAGVERRPLLASDFSSIRYHGSSSDRNPVHLIGTHLGQYIGSLALKHDEDFSVYKSLYERFGGADPTIVTPQEQR